MRKWLLMFLVFLSVDAFGQKAGQKDSTTTTQVIQPSPATPSRQVWIKGWLRADSAWVNVAIPFGTLKDTLDAFRTRIGTGGSGSTDLSGVRDTIADIIIDVGDLQTGAIPFSGTNGNALEFSADTIRNMVVISPLQKDAGGLRILNQMSVDYDGFGLKFKNDQQSPVAFSYYGTAVTAGVKGYFTFKQWWDSVRTGATSLPAIEPTWRWTKENVFVRGLTFGETGTYNGRVVFASEFDTEDASWIVQADSTPVEGATVRMILPPKATGMYYFATTSDTSTFLTYVKSLLDLKAPLASPTFTGTVTTPLGAGTVRSSAGGVLSVTASDTVGLGTSLDGKVSKSDSTVLYSTPTQTNAKQDLMAARLVYTAKFVGVADDTPHVVIGSERNLTGLTHSWERFNNGDFILFWSGAVADSIEKITVMGGADGVGTHSQAAVVSVEVSLVDKFYVGTSLAGINDDYDGKQFFIQVWVINP